MIQQGPDADLVSSYTMGRIAVAMLAGVCSKEVVQLRPMEQSSNFGDEMNEGRSSVRAEEERVEREGWIVNN